MDDATALKAVLANTLWLGGATGSGKSTVASALAAKHGWRVYVGDVEERDSHLKRITSERYPYFARLLAKTMDERWVDPTPNQLLDDMAAFHGESLALIVEDLLEREYKGPALVEGHHFMPRQLAPLLSGPGQACWLLATPGFRVQAFERRGNMWRMPNETRDPALAMRNRLGRDALYANEMAIQAAELGLPALEVHGQPLEEVTAWVEARFLAYLAARA
jgi:hypothetical protein